MGVPNVSRNSSCVSPKYPSSKYGLAGEREGHSKPSALLNVVTTKAKTTPESCLLQSGEKNVIKRAPWFSILFLEIPISQDRA
jgi:hypothetical protein